MMYSYQYIRIRQEEKMSRWTLVIPEETDRIVRTHLARHGGKKGDLSKFVTRAVQKEVFRRTMEDVQRRNTDLTEEQAMAACASSLIRIYTFRLC
jgi:hypothetical protein